MGTPGEAADALVTMPSADRKALAKQLKAILGGKSPKVVRLADFAPKEKTLWEETDIEALVQEFRAFLDGEWEKGRYLTLDE